MSILILDDWAPRPPTPPSTGATGPVKGSYQDDLAAPHMKMPMSFDGGRAALVEQGSLDEIIQNIATIVSTPKGFRTELPAFGLPPQTFKMGGVSEADIRRAIDRWEERAQYVLSEDPTLLQQLVDLIMIRVQEAEQGG